MMDDIEKGRSGYGFLPRHDLGIRRLSVNFRYARWQPRLPALQYVAKANNRDRAVRVIV